MDHRIAANANTATVLVAPARHVDQQHHSSPIELLDEGRGRFRSLEFDYASPTVAARCLEIVVAVVALTITAPLALVITLLIRRGSPGPVLFKQTRIREGMQPFTIYKFRSLYADSEERFPELFQFDHSDDETEDFMFKLEEDPRVTPQGAWLRSTSLDEIPNFWNLLKGDVALVGPRPEIPEMLPNYDNYMLKKFSVRPGITGLTQVSGRSDLSFLEGIELDLEYVETRSFLLDLKILWKTFLACLKREGAR